MWTQEWEFPEHWENKHNLLIFFAQAFLADLGN